MKRADDFKKAMETEESFRLCVQRTVASLVYEEEKPVKKKVSFGLVLALVLVLVTAGAVAAEQWGILSFLKGQGKTPTEDMLQFHAGAWRRKEDLVKITVNEGLYEESILYLAVTVEPYEESTLVLPLPENTKTYRTDEISMNSAMGTNAFAANQTVLDYAREKGFAHVVMLEVPSLHADSTGGVKAPQSNRPDAIQYEMMEDGRLRFILQKQIEHRLEEGFPEKTEWVSLYAMGYKSDVKDNGAWLHGFGQTASIQYELFGSDLSRRSVAEDAHDIAGYRGYVEYVSVTPYEDYAAVTIRINDARRENDDLWMSGPYWAVLDEEGNRMCYVEMKLQSAIYQDDRSLEHSTLHFGTIPLDCVPEGNRFTLQAENWNNHNLVYDCYTYTLE